MDVRQLSYFIAVYEQGSISAAARQCCITQPSLSTAIRQLEQELGVILFTRLPKGVSPTDDADKLYGHAGRLISQVNSIKASFVQPVKKVQFKLGLIRALGVERMSQLLREFSLLVDGLELHLVEPTEQCDARIITAAQLNAGEVFEPIWHDSYMLAIPPASPLMLKSSIALADFENLALIKRTPCDAWNSLYPELGRRNIKPDIRADIQTIEYALGLVSAGIGCALVPDFYNLNQRSDVLLKNIDELALQRTIGLAYRRTNDTQPLKILIQLCLHTANIAPTSLQFTSGVID